jgi:hypothetical protein
VQLELAETMEALRAELAQAAASKEVFECR